MVEIAPLGLLDSALNSWPKHLLEVKYYYLNNWFLVNGHGPHGHGE